MLLQLQSERGRQRRRLRTDRFHHHWWSPVILLFTSKEMRSFVASVKTVGARPDKMFGFGYSGPDHVIQIRAIDIGSFVTLATISSSDVGERHDDLRLLGADAE